MKSVRSTPGRILTLAIGIPVLLAAMVQGAFSATALLARSSEKHSASYAWHGGTFRLDNTEGSVTIRRSTSATTLSVTTTEHYGLKRPSVKAQVTSDGVQLTSSCSAVLFGDFCSVDYVVLVPSGVPLHLRTGDGHVSLVGVDAAVDVSSGDGDISGSDLRSANVTTSSGDGSVSLQWSAAPTRVAVSLGDGSISVKVPAGSGPYAITHEMGDGSASITVAEDPKAPRSLVLKMGDGSLSVQ